MMSLTTSSYGASGTKIDNFDGTYHYALPAGASTATHWTDFVEWTYVGQADYAWTPAPYGAVPILTDNFVEPGDDGLGDIVGTTRLDDLGREWVATSVDTGGLNAFVDGYNAALGEGASGTEPHTSEKLFDPSTEDLTWYPKSWAMATCTSTGGVVREVHQWNGESRAAFSTPPTIRQQKMVAVFSGQSFVCSGVLVDKDSVLTASHCLIDSNGVNINIDYVCTRGNAQSGAECAEVDDQFPHPSYDPMDSDAKQVKRDIGVLALASDLGLGNSMALSRARGSTIRSHDSYKSAYPSVGVVPNHCAPNNPTPVNATASSAGKHGYWDKGLVFDTTMSVIWIRTDNTPGESGSPSYYYPGGCCGANYATGSHSGHLQVKRRSSGAVVKQGLGSTRVRPVRKWLLSLVQ